jgi:hypothetical protein
MSMINIEEQLPRLSLEARQQMKNLEPLGCQRDSLRYREFRYTNLRMINCAQRAIAIAL